MKHWKLVLAAYVAVGSVMAYKTYKQGKDTQLALIATGTPPALVDAAGNSPAVIVTSGILWPLHLLAGIPAVPKH